jgi:alpha-ketoglutarate-dependent taurine dioxygenase
MVKEVFYDVDDFSKASHETLESWKDKSLKVFVLRANKQPEDVKSYFESIFPLLGRPEALAEDVNLGDRGKQRTGEIWMEVRYDPKHPDAYRHSANAQPLHTDGSYIPNFPSSTLLVCKANAGVGGETTFIDSKAIYNSLKEENPDLLDKLLNTKIEHARSGDVRDDYVIKKEGDDVFVNWNYYCVSSTVDSSTRALVEEFQQFLLNSPKIKEETIGVKLHPGDGVFWRDNYVMHGRNSFVANMESERFIWKCAIDIGKEYNGHS